jgi:hypothetical protein
MNSDITCDKSPIPPRTALRLLDDLLNVPPDDAVREIARNAALLIEDALETAPTGAS